MLDRRSDQWLERATSAVLGLVALRTRGIDLHAHAERLKARLGDSEPLSHLLAGEDWMLPALRNELRQGAGARAAADLARWWNEERLDAVGIGSPGYPDRLLHLYDPPPVLFYERVGEDALAKLPAQLVAVVGSRNCDQAGAELTQAFAAELANRGVCIVSGLALGIDAAAHRGALSGSAAVPTVAVLGSGLKHLHPRTNIGLARELVARGGLLVSEFEPAEPPYPGNFLRRNRIIAALAQAVLVVQAGDKSGSLVTARHALELGRDVLVIPGDIRDPRYAGSNRLLQQGAHLVTCLGDIEQCLPELPLRAAARADLSGEARQVLRALASAARTRAELQRVLGGSTGRDEMLLDLELRGLVTAAPGDKLALTTLGAQHV